MIQVTIVLNKVECLEKLARELMKNGITGGTILDSYGMARSFGSSEELPFFSVIKEILEIGEDSSRVIFMIAEESQVRTISKVVNEVTGGLQNANTGIMFCTPVVYIEGLRKNKTEE